MLCTRGTCQRYSSLLLLGCARLKTGLDLICPTYYPRISGSYKAILRGDSPIEVSDHETLFTFELVRPDTLYTMMDLTKRST
jgi:hypothetical protein